MTTMESNYDCNSEKYNIIIQNDSHFVVNSVTDKICVSRKIINLIEDIRMLSYFSRNIRIDYYNRLINKDADMMVKMCTINLVYLYCIHLFSLLIYFHFQKKKKINASPFLNLIFHLSSFFRRTMIFISEMNKYER